MFCEFVECTSERNAKFSSSGVGGSNFWELKSPSAAIGQDIRGVFCFDPPKILLKLFLILGAQWWKNFGMEGRQPQTMPLVISAILESIADVLAVSHTHKHTHTQKNTKGNTSNIVQYWPPWSHLHHPKGHVLVVTKSYVLNQTIYTRKTSPVHLR